MLRRIINYVPFYMPIFIGTYIVFNKNYLSSLFNNNKFNYTSNNSYKNIKKYCEECNNPTDTQICYNCWMYKFNYPSSK